MRAQPAFPPASDGLTSRPLELFQGRGGCRLAGGCELLRRQLRLEPIEGRTGGVGVGRGQLLVTQREREDHGGPLLFRGIVREAGADPAQCKELERDGLRGVRTLERLAEALACLGAVSERERREADAAEHRDHSPAVVDLGKGLVAGPPEPQGLGVVTQPERAQARAAERVARSAGLADGREQVVCLHVQS